MTNSATDNFRLFRSGGSYKSTPHLLYSYCLTNTEHRRHTEASAHCNIQTSLSIPTSPWLIPTHVPTTNPSYCICIPSLVLHKHQHQPHIFICIPILTEPAYHTMLHTHPYWTCLSILIQCCIPILTLRHTTNLSLHHHLHSHSYTWYISTITPNTCAHSNPTPSSYMTLTSVLLCN